MKTKRSKTPLILVSSLLSLFLIFPPLAHAELENFMEADLVLSQLNDRGKDGARRTHFDQDIFDCNFMLKAYNCMQLNTMKSFLSKNQLLLLRLFHTNPGRSFYIQEIGRILGKKPGVFQRTLNALETEGILKSERRANSRFFQVNTSHPLYPELKKIVAKTAGVEGRLKEIFARIEEVKIVVLYGSFAKGKEREDSDIDLLIVGSPNVERRLLKELPKLERQLQREVNYKLYSRAEYRRKRTQGDSFLEEVLTDQHMILKGNPNAV